MDILQHLASRTKSDVTWNSAIDSTDEGSDVTQTDCNEGSDVTWNEVTDGMEEVMSCGIQ